jgi:hypothetical protein
MTPRRKLPARYHPLVMPLILSIMMSFVVSGISTAAALGFTPVLIFAWARAWGLSWIVAYPTLLVVLPLVRRVTSWLVEVPGR